MKRFKILRPVSTDFADKLKAIDKERGENLSKNLERGLMAIPLLAHEALTTAYINDVDSLGVFAQQLYGFGRPRDVFLGISTSGNSKNVMLATVVARALYSGSVVKTKIQAFYNEPISVAELGRCPR